MRLLRKNAPASELGDQVYGNLRLVPRPESDYEEVGYGREPQIIGTRTASVDPYAAWLEQRAETERQDRPPIRWVHRYHALDGATAAARAASACEDDPQTRWVHHYRGAVRPEAGGRSVARPASRPLAGV